ncbi:MULTISPECIES: MFS transporter [unclassified Streptomyces]|uniref:MFS transporter n=1 Tax=unclassified Streptomyces TaxID=2593676 RepID=UPI001587CDEF|nr:MULTISPECIES: MFS transporter [unclassified Streptomyces]NUV72133.1 MFS transporter [Streptomyces sp. CAI-121]NUW03584.1 MFS transporter [Streptomyces sp. CAI 127]NUW18127.1 MFS transporter [Streptomyces sp. CAI-68]
MSGSPASAPSGPGTDRANGAAGRPSGRLLRFVLAILPSTSAGRKLAAGAVADSVGSGMFLAASTLYFVTVVGIPATRVGAVISIAGIIGLISPVPFGRLADRVGPTRVYVALLAARGVGYAGFALVDSFWPYAVLTCVLTALDRGCSPLQQVVVGLIEGGENQARTMASIRSVRNIGLTAGFLLAGAVLAIEHRAAFAALFLGNALTFFVIALVVERLRRGLESPAGAGAGATTAKQAGAGPEKTGAGPEKTGPLAQEAAGEPDSGPARVRSPFLDLRFLLFTVSNGILSLHDSVLFLLLPLWLTTATSAPASAVSVLLAVNTVLTVLLQVYVAKFADTTARALRLIWFALVPLLLSCGVFAGAEYVPAWPAAAFAVIAVVLLTVGENVHSVAVWNLSYDMSPAPARARYLATFSLGVTGQQIVGPVLMTAVVLPLGTSGWALLAGVFLLAGLGLRATGGPRPAPTADRAPAPEPAVTAGATGSPASTDTPTTPTTPTPSEVTS